MPEILTLRSCDDARAVLAEFPAVGTERVPLERAAGRVLALSFVAPSELPELARATMDGFAVRSPDVAAASEAAPTRLRVKGRVPMGGVFAGTLGPGEAVAIGTGGVIPDGADAVVMVEYTRSSGADEVEIQRPSAAGLHIIQRGEDIRPGEELLTRGRRLRPDHVGLLAAFGTVQVQVYRQPRVAVLSTGNELVPPGVQPVPGQIRDVNTYVLAGQAEGAGALATHGGIAPDDELELARRAAELLESHDVLFLSGGSSVGVRDLTSQVLGAMGPPGILFHGIAVRPGKPTLVARVGDKPVIGMPGNPVSSHVIFDVFMRELLLRLGGEEVRDLWPARTWARLSRPWSAPAGKEDYVRVRLQTRDDGLWAEPLLGGSSSFGTVVRADGLLRLPVGAGNLALGTEVEVWLYTGRRGRAG